MLKRTKPNKQCLLRTAICQNPHMVAAKPTKTTAAKAAAETCRSDAPAETVVSADGELEAEPEELEDPDELEVEPEVAVAVVKPVLVD